VSLNIGELLKPQRLAHLTMGDGYWDNGTVMICTDNFSNDEVQLLANTIINNFGNIAKLKQRKRENGVICWRIRISTRRAKILRDIIVPYMILEMLYKLNIN